MTCQISWRLQNAHRSNRNLIVMLSFHYGAFSQWEGCSLQMTELFWMSIEIRHPLKQYLRIDFDVRGSAYLVACMAWKSNALLTSSDVKPLAQGYTKTWKGFVNLVLLGIGRRNKVSILSTDLAWCTNSRKKISRHAQTLSFIPE